MNHYTVRVPIAGYIEAYVVAPSEKEAEEKALNMTGDEADTELFYESMRHITTGNVFWGPLNDIEVTLDSTLGPDDDDA